MSVPHPFRSERLEYRAYNPDKDAEFLERLHTEPFGYINASTSVHRPVGKKVFEGVLEELEKSLLFAIIYKLDQDPGNAVAIGSVSLSASDYTEAHHRCSILAIDVVPEHQGQGYGTEMLNWTLEWGFRQANLHRIELEYVGWNSRVKSIYERCGFVEEGRRRQAVFKDGQWWDEILMSILEDEWSARWHGNLATRPKDHTGDTK